MGDHLLVRVPPPSSFPFTMSAKCATCGKTAYPLESVSAAGQTYHKLCFKCDVCKCTLNVKNFKAREGKIYCHTHLPTEKHTQVADSVLTKHATAAPKLNTQVGVSKGTGEKPNVGMDTVVTQTALKAPKKDVQVGVSKGTGEKPNIGVDTIATQSAFKAPKKDIERGIQKGTGEQSNYGADATYIVAAKNAPKLTTQAGIRLADASTTPEAAEIVNAGANDGAYQEEAQEE